VKFYSFILYMFLLLPSFSLLLSQLRHFHLYIFLYLLFLLVFFYFIRLYFCFFFRFIPSRYCVLSLVCINFPDFVSLFP